MKRQSLGFTLIEVLVVLFIISIVSTVILLSIGRSENREMETFASELTQLLTLAEEQAMLQPTVLGLSLNEHSFQFKALQADLDKKQSQWMPFEDKILGKHMIPQGIHLGVVMADKTQKTLADLPQIIISTNGDFTPFTIYVGKKGEKPSYAIYGDANGHVTHQALA